MSRSEIGSDSKIANCNCRGKICSSPLPVDLPMILFSLLIILPLSHSFAVSLLLPERLTLNRDSSYQTLFSTSANDDKNVAAMSVKISVSDTFDGGNIKFIRQRPNENDARMIDVILHIKPGKFLSTFLCHYTISLLLNGTNHV